MSGAERCGAVNPYTVDGVQLRCGRERGHTGVHVDFDTYRGMSVGFGKERATAEENERDAEKPVAR